MVILGAAAGCAIVHMPPVQRVMGRAVIDNTARATGLPRGLVKASLKGGAR